MGSAVFGDARGGDVTVNATESIDISGMAPGESVFPQVNESLKLFGGEFPAGLLTTVFSGGNGAGGDLTVNTPRLTLQEGGVVATGTIAAPGNSGRLTLEADEITLIGTATDGFFSTSILTSALAGASGQGGDLKIETRLLNLRDGAQVRAGTSGTGNSGNVAILADEINLDGVSPDGQFSSSILAGVEDLSNLFPGAMSSGNGGDLRIISGRIILSNGGEISASTFSNGNAGNLLINARDIEVNGIFATGSLLTTRGGIRIDVRPGARGNGGNLTIDTESLRLRNGGQVSTNILGQGSGGVLRVDAREIEAIGVSENFVSGLVGTVLPGSTGNGGNITVNTDRLSLREGAMITATVFSSGQGGNLEVNAGTIEAMGSGIPRSNDPQFSQLIQLLAGRFPSGITTTVIPGATGNGGDLMVQAQQIAIGDGGQIGTGTLGAGASGNLQVQARTIDLRGVSVVGSVPSSIFTSVLGGDATGKGGEGIVTAQQLTLRDGGQVRAGTSGQGDSGSLTVRANQIELTGRSENNLFPSSILNSVEDLSFFIPGAIGSGNAGDLRVESDRITLTDGGEITASNSGSGNAGNLRVNAREITVSGVAIVDQQIIPSGLRVDVLPQSTGNGGDLTVNVGRLILNEGGQISTNMFSGVEATRTGNLQVNGIEIEATGVSANSPSGLITNVQPGAAGSAGNLTVNTERLVLREGAAISSLVAGSGRGGMLTVNATEIEATGTSFVEATNPIEVQILQFLNGQFPSGILTTVLPTATGQGGDLTVAADQIRLDRGAQIGSGTFGIGNSGNLNVQADTINIRGTSTSSLSFPPTSILTSVLGGGATGNGGDALISAQRLTLQDGGQLRSGTSGQGNSGNLTVQAQEIELTGRSLDNRFPSSILVEVEDFTDLAPGAIGRGNGGNLAIDSNTIKVQDGAEITASSSGTGAAGSLAVQANALQINQGILSAETASGDQGNITLDIPRISLQNSAITTNATGTATGGNININTELLTARNSQISANAVEGAGGNVQIQSRGVFADQIPTVTASSEFGFDGTVEIDTAVDPTQGIVRLPGEILDASSIVAQNICKFEQGQIARGSSLVITGRGGLPSSPTETLTALQGLVEWEAGENSQLAGGNSAVNPDNFVETSG
ncbi:MAG: S-layer family protein, partial [Oscillatoriales cyanobacterium SM2_3_0]|nr:S-layer family protein [Oscillatoriales cyanobacterium SM2_3_0]